jgi:hypothetical protein
VSGYAGGVLVRFLSNLFTLIAGTLLLAACFAFRSTVLGWLALAAGCAVLVVILVAFAFRGRGSLQRTIDAATVLLAAWTTVAARSFDAGTLKWTSVAEAFALLGLGAGGLLSGELELRAALARAGTRSSSEMHRKMPHGAGPRRGEHALGGEQGRR